MKQNVSYVSLCTPHLTKSINFYEDHFGLVAEQEKNGYAFLRHKDHVDVCLELIKPDHEVLPESFRKTTDGVIVTFPVDDIQSMWNELFLDGVTMLNEITVGACGQTHFFVQDPYNPILIKVVQAVH